MKMGPLLLVSSVYLLSITPFYCFADISETRADVNGPVRLEDYLLCAANNNPGLKAAYEKWRAAVEQVPQAKSLPEPQISYGYATESTPQRKMFDAMQMFPWFGTINARTEVASAESKAAYKQFEAKKLELFYEVKQAFYEFSYLAKAT